MSELDMRTDLLEQVSRSLSARALPVETWGADDRELVARLQRELANPRWADHRALIAPIAHEAMFEAVTDDDAVHAALRRRRQAVASSITAGPATGTGPLFQCATHVASPPYPTGDPLLEVYGEDPTIVNESVFVSDDGRWPFDGLAEPAGRKTFSRLAVPAEGAVSLAVGLGKLASEPQGYALYPPQSEYPQQFPVPGGSLEVTAAEGSVGYLRATATPGSPVPSHARMNVTVDLTIGNGTDPFYLVVPARGPILQAFGVVHLMLIDSTGTVVETEGTFLEHREGANGLLGPVTVKRQLSVHSSLALRSGSWWVYAGVSVRLVAHRWFVLTPPEPPARNGFVGIDLRAPHHHTHPVHPLLSPAGPVTVRRIEMDLCSDPVLHR